MAGPELEDFVKNRADVEKMDAKDAAMINGIILMRELPR